MVLSQRILLYLFINDDPVTIFVIIHFILIGIPAVHQLAVSGHCKDLNRSLRILQDYYLLLLYSQFYSDLFILIFLQFIFLLSPYREYFMNLYLLIVQCSVVIGVINDIICSGFNIDYFDSIFFYYYIFIFLFYTSITYFININYRKIISYFCKNRISFSNYIIIGSKI